MGSKLILVSLHFWKKVRVLEKRKKEVLREEGDRIVMIFKNRLWILSRGEHYEVFDTFIELSSFTQALNMFISVKFVLES